MPIITVQFIKDVVATPEQKRELIVRLTDTFCDILGDVVRPFVYCLIQETPQQEWGIAGVPMPDLVYLTGDKHANVIDKSNTLMRGAIVQMQAAAASQSNSEHAKEADDVWRGSSNGHNGTSPSTKSVDAQADDVWRGNTNSSHGTADEHRKLFARWFEELWNKKNYNIAHELVHPDFTAHGAGGQDIKQGPDGVIGMVKAWHAAMPDGRMIMDDIITEGDLSTIRMTWEATHTGQFGEIPASGKRISVTSIGIDRVVDGKITEGWGELNMLGMLQQMGAIPTPDNQAQPANGEKKIEDRRALIYRMYDESNKGNVEFLREVLSEDFVSYGGAGFQDIHGSENFINLYRTFAAAFPDLQFEVQHVVVGGDMAVARGIQSGTHKGNFMGMVPATGKKVTWTGTAIFKFNTEGKIVERWQDLDFLGLFQQLGVIPAFQTAGG